MCSWRPLAGQQWDLSSRVMSPACWGMVLWRSCWLMALTSSPRCWCLCEVRQTGLGDVWPVGCRNPWFSQGMIETTWLMSLGRSLGPQHCKGSSSCVFSKAKGQVRVKALPCHESWVFRRRCLGAALLARGAYGSAAAGADMKWDRTEGNMACNSRWFIQSLLFQQLHWWVRVYSPVSAACFHRPHCFYICGLHHVRIKGT